MKIKTSQFKQISLLTTLFLTINLMAVASPETIILPDTAVSDTSCNTLGVMRFSDVEGGCWFIELDNGAHLEAVSGVDDRFFIDGLKVKLSYALSDQVSICMVGSPAIIYCIEALPVQNHCQVDFDYERLRIACDKVMSPERCGEFMYRFKIRASDSLFKWVWIFNMIDTVYAEEPVYIFPTDGIYSVCLEVQYENGCYAHHCERIQVGDSACRANFEYYPLWYLYENLESFPHVDNTIMPYPYPHDNTYRFIDASIGDVVSWKWEFSDDSVYYTKNVTHKFISSGTYKVCLTIVTSDSCTSTTCMVIFVEPVRYCHASFRYVNEFHWDSGVDVNEDSTIVPGSPEYDSLLYDSIFNDKTIQFYNSSWGNISEVYWDFGDGTYSHDWDPLHEYAAYGEYEVCLTVKSDSCTDTYCAKVIVGPAQPCKANFEYCNYNGDYDHDTTINDDLKGYLVGFRDLSKGDIDSWHWSFGDGSFSYEQNPLHKYSYPGTYSVCLKVYGDSGCNDVICKRVIVGDDCDIDFDWKVYFPDCNGFMPAYEFEIKSTLPVGYAYWEFGDGTFSYDKNPIHVFETYGEYQVCLTAQQVNGCKTKICKYVNHYLDDMDSMFFKSCGTTLIDKIDGQKSLTIDNMYPNPASEEITFVINSSVDNEITVSFVNLLGTEKQVEKIYVNSGKNMVNVNINNLPDGNYVYKIIAGNNVLHGKLMVR